MATFGAPKAKTDTKPKADAKAEAVKTSAPVSGDNPFTASASADDFKVSRAPKPIPQFVYDVLRSEVAKSGVKAPVKDKAQYTELRSAIQRGAAELGVGVQVRPTQWVEGTTHLALRTTARRASKPRKYTRRDIENWFLAKYNQPLPEGRIPAEVRAEFRKANGYDEK